jgi:hypothetical protein
MPPCDPNKCTSISGQCVVDPFFIDPPKLQLLSNTLVETKIPPETTILPPETTILPPETTILPTTLHYDYNDNSKSIQWYHFKDRRWFYYNFFQLTHDYAEKSCNENGATLAIVTDQEVLNYLIDYVMDPNEYAFVSFYS